MPQDPSSAKSAGSIKDTTMNASDLAAPELATGSGRSLKESRGVRLPHLPGLDGLRALAVIAVLLYHADLKWIPGGFLGVEVFFVISGYLITSLLLAEWRQRGRVDLKSFWLRRARRLLPALYLLLVGTLAFAVVFLPGEVASLRNDALAAFAYVTNWYQILGHQSYFQSVGRPSLLKHLWSLAVEEQFYLLWPLLFTVGMSAGAARWRQHRMLVFIIAGAVASALLMAFLYKPDVDPSRIYYGTDTRASGLLIGAALAFLWEPGRFYTREAIRRALQGGSRWILPLLFDVAGLGALSVLVWFCLKINEFQPFLYKGGFACVGLTTAILIMVIVHPRTHLGGAVMGQRALRWIGVRSYGIYLWHWPIYMITRPNLDVPISGWPLLALRLAATVALADLSYRYVETPIRKGALEKSWRALRDARGGRRWRLSAQWAGAGMISAVIAVTLGVAIVQAKAPPPPSYLAHMKAIHTVKNAHKAASAEKTSEDAHPNASRATQKNGETTQAGEKTVEKAPKAGTAGKKAASKTSAAASVGPVTAVGDSVMLGAAPALEQDLPTLKTMDAQVGMQASTAVDILRSRAAAGQLGDVVIIHMGSNGTFTKEEFGEMMQILKGVKRVVFVNDKVPRTWEQSNNAMISEEVKKYPNAVLVDWYSAGYSHPEFFWDDAIHLRPEGAKFYADLITKQVNAAP